MHAEIDKTQGNVFRFVSFISMRLILISIIGITEFNKTNIFYIIKFGSAFKKDTSISF